MSKPAGQAQGEEGGARRALAAAAAAAVCLLLGLGVYGVWGVTDPLIAVAVAIVAAILLVFRRLPREGLVADVARLPAASLVAFLALVGLDVVVNFLFDTRIDIALGLLLAVAAFALVAYWYLVRLEDEVRVGKRALPLRALAALFIANALVLVGPFAYGLLSADTKPVPTTTTPVASQLDVRILATGDPLPAPPELPPTPLLDEFDVSYSVGYAAGDQVRWTMVDGDDQAQALEAIAAGDRLPTASTVPVSRPGADHVLLLLVDGTPPVVEEPVGLPDRPAGPGEVARWRRLARSAGGGDTGTFALLQTSDPGRIQTWDGFVPHGRAVSEQVLASQTATDAAARLEVGAPNSQADFALAMAYRPILLFDRNEPVPWPLSVSALFAGGAVSLCRDQGGFASECDQIERPRELENGDTHLQLSRPTSAVLRRRALDELRREERELEATQTSVAGAPPVGTPPAGTVPELGSAPSPPGAGSAIYVNPVEVGRRLYLDYWWYLPDNPVVLGGGALCGAGLVIADVTCPSHESDWEGITVVVGLGGRVPRVVAVQYAQHAGVVRYGWGLLRRRWDSDPRFAKLTAGIADAATRPLAFSARGTHATYPTPCAGGCQQIANEDLREEPHDGGLAWVGDFTAACGRSSCLQLLPTHRGGREPALWNAYDGTWGRHHCLLSYFCDSATPPTAPGTQGRYRDPAGYDGVVGPGWRFHPVPEES